MKLKDFISPKLVPVPSAYGQELKELYYSIFGETACSGCSALWIRQLVSWHEKYNKEIELTNQKVVVKDIAQAELKDIYMEGIVKAMNSPIDKCPVEQETETTQDALIQKCTEGNRKTGKSKSK